LTSEQTAVSGQLYQCCGSIFQHILDKKISVTGNFLLPFCLLIIKKPPINEYFIDSRTLRTEVLCAFQLSCSLRNVWFQLRQRARRSMADPWLRVHHCSASSLLTDAGNRVPNGLLRNVYWGLFAIITYPKEALTLRCFVASGELTNSVSHLRLFLDPSERSFLH
jgi:hypothetical protein